jgi:putative DNA-invertase from lambdoid prophage Rac
VSLKSSVIIENSKNIFMYNIIITMVVYGYLRVSTNKQEETNYKAAILELANQKGLTNIQWISETISGRIDWKRRAIGKEFEKMKSGDTIIMGEISRISRDFFGSMEFLAECRRKGVKVFSTNGDIPIKDDSTSNLLLSVTAWKNQIERENIAYRTKIGIQAAKSRGSVLGRPKNVMALDKDINNARLIQDEINKGIKKKHICEHFKITMPTLRKYMKSHNISEIQKN